MLAMSTAVLKTAQGEAVALKGVDVQAELTGLMSNVSITQNYQNIENTNIEAVYTFPLPLDAVLLDLTVTLGDKTLKGKIIEKQQAEAQYEEAITDGDSAIMLQETQPGLFTMNVGNILAGETIVIKFHYGALHSYQNKSLRFMLPTTIAPRYGDPLQAGIEPHQVPEHSLSADYGFSLKLVINGLLVNSDISCPTHPVSIKSESEKVVISMQQEVAAMDRDFVLNFDNILTSDSTARVEKDYQGYVALASFHCDFNVDEDTSPRSYKIVVDCSGSMSGDSMSQAKKALSKILESLRDGDFLNIIKFGSHYEMLAEEQLCINEQNKIRITNYIRNIDANMGGTEMDAALMASYKISQQMELSHDVLLITDGEVWNESELIQHAKNSHHRIFTIGVGSSVAENIVRELAETTGGACELVTPNESMANKIHRHFKRMFSPRAKSVNISWSQKQKNGTPRLCTPENIKSVYAGDTLHVFGWFDTLPEGHIALEVTLPDGTQLVDKSRYAAVLEKNDDYFLTRMGTADLLRNESSTEHSNMDESLKIEMAVKYQLMTPWTNYLVVHERTTDKAADLPDIRTVPQTLAAGWGGMGTMAGEICAAPLDMMMSKSRAPQRNSSALRKKKRAAPSIPMDDFMSDSAHISDDIFCDLDPIRELIPENILDNILSFSKNLNHRISVMHETDIGSLTLQDFKQLGAGEHLMKLLNDLRISGRNETELVLSILHTLINSGYKNEFDKPVTRAIRWACKQQALDNALLDEIKVKFDNLLSVNV